MQTVSVQTGPHCDVSVDGSLITLSAKGIAPVKIDCEALTTDTQVIVDVTSSADGTLHEGMHGDSYAASVVIPPREYVTAVDKKKKDSHGNPLSITKPAPVDMNKVTLKLWRYDLPIEQIEVIHAE